MPCICCFVGSSGLKLALLHATVSDIAQLLKLEAEYRRTQRRVRALEKILLPELEAEQKVLENALEELEIEEAVRVRLAAKK